MEDLSNLKLYSTGCPKCKVLEEQMAIHNHEFEVVSDMQPIISKGFVSVPVLELEDGTLLGFKEALDYVRGRS